MSREDFITKRAAAKRAAVLKAARERFAADGLDGASVERIAAEAQVSTATLYRQFPSKLALFEAVLRDSVESFAAAFAAQAKADPRARLERLAKDYAALLDDPVRAGLVRAVFAAAPGSPIVADVFYTHVKTVVAGAFHAAIASASAAKLLRKTQDDALPGSHLMGMIEHATLWRRLLTGEAGAHTPDQIALDALATFWAAYASQGAAQPKARPTRKPRGETS